MLAAVGHILVSPETVQLHNKLGISEFQLLLMNFKTVLNVLVFCGNNGVSGVKMLPSLLPDCICIALYMVLYNWEVGHTHQSQTYKFKTTFIVLICNTHF
jgi:hypothetical protein